MAKLQDIKTPLLQFEEGAAPATPASGVVEIYAKADGLLYSKDDAGAESQVSGADTSKADKRTSVVEQTASYTLALTDEATVQKCSSSSAIVVTIPLNSAVAFPTNSEIVLVRYGSGTVTVAATSSVTLYSSGSKKAINAQYEAATLKKIATDEWLLIGSLAT